jgi:hypothetical protein
MHPACLEAGALVKRDFRVYVKTVKTEKQVFKGHLALIEALSLSISTLICA